MFVHFVVFIGNFNTAAYTIFECEIKTKILIKVEMKWLVSNRKRDQHTNPWKFFSSEAKSALMFWFDSSCCYSDKELKKQKKIPHNTIVTVKLDIFYR